MMEQYSNYTIIREELDDALRGEVISLMQEVANETVERDGQDPKQYTFDAIEEVTDGITKISWTMTKSV